MRGIILAAAATIVASQAQAQGNLSVQGFGYPAGGLSTRSIATGGAIAEFDPQSVLNPATILGSGQPSLFFQYEPELRTVETGSASSKTTTSRFPLVGITLPLGQRYALGLSSTSFLDRSSSTRFAQSQVIGTTTVTGTEVFRTLGGINDVRLALAMSVGTRMRLGLAGHAFTGQNRVTSSLTFEDTATYLPLVQGSNLDYSGAAVSGGAEWRPLSVLAVAISGRKGGNITMSTADTSIATARIPDQYGASVMYSGFTGLTVAARGTRNLWSSLDPLGSNRVSTFDGWDFGFGAEGTGPRIASRVISLRLGGRYRGLPFGASGEQVREFSYSGGLGVAFARDRAALDFSALRAARFTGTFQDRGAVDEKAYIFSVGLRVRP